jgi:hypothetical protein
MSIFCTIDDKHIPLYRIVWISELPHFCGSDECQREGQYEIRLEQNETVWSTLQERDAALAALEAWHNEGRGTKGKG